MATQMTDAQVEALSDETFEKLNGRVCDSCERRFLPGEGEVVSEYGERITGTCGGQLVEEIHTFTLVSCGRCLEALRNEEWW